MTVAKLAPLALLILFGVARFAQQPQMIHPSEIAAPGMANWPRAMVVVSFPFLGWGDSRIPTGEVKDPRRAIPFALSTGLLVCNVPLGQVSAPQNVTVENVGTAPLNLSDVAPNFKYCGGYAPQHLRRKQRGDARRILHRGSGVVTGVAVGH